jgi:putative hydrolase of the HAD superfamily
MNFIFDIGNVLIHFKPKEYLETLFAEQPLRDAMFETVFQSPEWLALDEGTITLLEAEEILCRRAPEHIDAIRRTLNGLDDMFAPIVETITLLPILKKAGHKLYYLSNCHYEISRHLLREYPFFGEFNGGIFSCDVRQLKPSHVIYHTLLQTYRLVPEDCLFFDDMEENVAAANEVGIRGILFSGAACVKEYL